MSQFTYQTALRVADAALLSNVLRQVKPKCKIESQIPRTVRQKPHFLFYLDSQRIVEVPLRGEASVPVKHKLFHHKVVAYLTDIEGTRSIEPIHIWKDATVIIRNIPKKIRASSSYDQFGQFYDWVSVFDPPNSIGKENPVGFPAKLLLIYRDRNGELSAIVNACHYRNKVENSLSTPLTSRWSLEFDEERKGSQITLRKIKLTEIIDVLYVVEHAGENPSSLGINAPDKNKKRERCYVDVVESRKSWVHEFFNAEAPSEKAGKPRPTQTPKNAAVQRKERTVTTTQQMKTKTKSDKMKRTDSSSVPRKKGKRK